MAIVTIPAAGKRISDQTEVTDFLRSAGIDHENWIGDANLGPDASDDEILAAYQLKIDELKSKGGYVTADVINVTPATPGLDEMLDRFNKEHWHDEDEVRFIVGGSGLFHIAPPGEDVFSVEMSTGDLIRVPAGTLHWFDLCSDRTIRAIRLFQDPAGWTPHYTNSGIDSGFAPLCFGDRYFPAAVQA